MDREQRARLFAMDYRERRVWLLAALRIRLAPFEARVAHGEALAGNDYHDWHWLLHTVKRLDGQLATLDSEAVTYTQPSMWEAR